MVYKEVCEARFLSRSNRFAALVDREGCPERVHVKNTGRCAELLVPGARVWLSRAQNPARRTPYDLIAVEKQRPAGPLLINMDSAAPNAVAGEWLRSGGLGRLDEVRAEYRLGDSRFDFFARRGEEKLLIEVKGCTLEEEGLARFPDAPTLRGLKHVRELTRLSGQGWKCFAALCPQLGHPPGFRPGPCRGKAGRGGGIGHGLYRYGGQFADRPAGAGGPELARPVNQQGPLSWQVSKFSVDKAGGFLYNQTHKHSEMP